MSADFNETVRSMHPAADIIAVEAMTAPLQPKITAKQVRDLVGAPARASTLVVARGPHELKRVIVNERDLFATMKGYRAALHLSQLAADDAAGTHSGYVGKLEIGTRLAVNRSFWWWLWAFRLGMILVPAADACNANTCPVCGQAVPNSGEA